MRNRFNRKKQLIKECEKYGIYTDDLKGKPCELFQERILSIGLKAAMKII